MNFLIHMCLTFVLTLCVIKLDVGWITFGLVGVAIAMLIYFVKTRWTQWQEDRAYEHEFRDRVKDSL